MHALRTPLVDSGPDEVSLRRWLAALIAPLDPPSAAGALAEVPLARLARASAEELAQQFRLEPDSARRIVAAFALGAALESERRPPAPSLRHPAAVFAHLSPLARGLEQETFWSLLLDGKQRLRRTVVVTTGTLTASLVHPREVFREAVRDSAAALIVAHNHPSGDPEPSAEDLAVTERLRQAGEVLGIPLQDHVVLGEGVFVSLRERMGLPHRPRGSARGR
jgi:DNA repair protein RadC